MDRMRHPIQLGVPAAASFRVWLVVWRVSLRHGGATPGDSAAAPHTLPLPSQESH